MRAVGIVERRSKRGKAAAGLVSELSPSQICALNSNQRQLPNWAKRPPEVHRKRDVESIILNNSEKLLKGALFAKLVEL